MAFKVQPLGYSDQLIHMEVQPCSGASSFYCSFVYVHNTANERKGLWDDLRGYKRNYEGPWLLMGDINCVLDYRERLGSMLETEDAHNSLLQIQKELQDNPSNSELCTKERKVTELYKKKLHCYVQFLQQEARIKWLQEGDDNTALFYRSLRAQRLRYNLYTIHNMQGLLQQDPDSGLLMWGEDSKF
ncbi:Lysine histidine transporter-like 1 [Bienertia sinuspersici]